MALAQLERDRPARAVPAAEMSWLFEADEHDVTPIEIATRRKRSWEWQQVSRDHRKCETGETNLEGQQRADRLTQNHALSAVEVVVPG